MTTLVFTQPQPEFPLPERQHSYVTSVFVLTEPDRCGTCSMYLTAQDRNGESVHTQDAARREQRERDIADFYGES